MSSPSLIVQRNDGPKVPGRDLPSKFRGLFSGLGRGFEGDGAPGPVNLARCLENNDKRLSSTGQNASGSNRMRASGGDHMMFRKTVWAATSVLALSLPAAAQETDSGATGEGSGGPVDIATVVKIAGIQWFNRMEEGVKQYAADTGANAFQVGPAQADPQQQAALIEDMIAQGRGRHRRRPDVSRGARTGSGPRAGGGNRGRLARGGVPAERQLRHRGLQERGLRRDADGEPGPMHGRRGRVCRVRRLADLADPQPVGGRRHRSPAGELPEHGRSSATRTRPSTTSSRPTPPRRRSCARTRTSRASRARPRPTSRASASPSRSGGSRIRPASWAPPCPPSPASTSRPGPWT